MVNIKLKCDCGNEQEFNTIDEETGEQTSYREDEGQYARIKSFTLRQTHDVIGIVCDKCGKVIWCFT